MFEKNPKSKFCPTKITLNNTNITQEGLQYLC